MARPSRNAILKALTVRPPHGRLLVLTHDHPDPDAVASAWALALLMRHRWGRTPRIVYGGVIARMENQTMVRLLRIPVAPLRREELARAAAVMLVDTQPPFQNNPFSPHDAAWLVIDHHPRHRHTRAATVHIDPRAGATATLLTGALLAARVRIPARLATALVYAISSETQQLGRGAGPRDVAAYRALFPLANTVMLSKIQHPPRPARFFATLDRAIRGAFIAGRIIGVHLGRVHSQDVVAHMADFLLTHEGIDWSMVTGRYNGRLHVSLRTRVRTVNAGRLLWRLLGAGTAGGGHGMIAGGAVVLGRGASEPQWRRAEQHLARAFLRSRGRRAPFRVRHPYQRLGPTRGAQPGSRQR